MISAKLDIISYKIGNWTEQLLYGYSLNDELFLKEDLSFMDKPSIYKIISQGEVSSVIKLRCHKDLILYTDHNNSKLEFLAGKTYPLLGRTKEGIRTLDRHLNSVLIHYRDPTYNNFIEENF